MDHLEKRFDNYGERGLRRHWRAREYSAIVHLLEPRRDARLLDLGPGTGHHALKLKGDFAMDVVAVESSPDPGHFDFILAAGLLEFVERPEKFFERCVPLMNSDARFVILVPTVGVSGRMYKIVRALGRPVHLRGSEDYVRMARGFGLSLCGWRPCGPLSQALAFKVLDQ